MVQYSSSLVPIPPVSQVIPSREKPTCVDIIGGTRCTQKIYSALGGGGGGGGEGRGGEKGEEEEGGGGEEEEEDDDEEEEEVVVVVLRSLVHNSPPKMLCFDLSEHQDWFS
jgi:hypothetical protein